MPPSNTAAYGRRLTGQRHPCARNIAPLPNGLPYHSSPHHNRSGLPPRPVIGKSPEPSPCQRPSRREQGLGSQPKEWPGSTTLGKPTVCVLKGLMRYHQCDADRYEHRCASSERHTRPPPPQSSWQPPSHGLLSPEGQTLWTLPSAAQYVFVAAMQDGAYGQRSPHQCQAQAYPPLLAAELPSFWQEVHP